MYNIYTSLFTIKFKITSLICKLGLFTSLLSKYATGLLPSNNVLTSVVFKWAAVLTRCYLVLMDNLMSQTTCSRFKDL